MAASAAAYDIFPPTPKIHSIAGQPPKFLWGHGTPVGASQPWSGAPKGSIYIQDDATDNTAAIYEKNANNGADADWVPMSPVSQAPVANTASTLTVTRALHAGKTITLSRAAGIAVTLPAATGSGDKYRFIVITTFTGASTIKVVGDDIMKGTAVLFADGGDTVVGFATAADSDTIDLLGTSNSTGGISGEEIFLEDIAADTWYVRIVSDAGGTEATPFSATVT